VVFSGHYPALIVVVLFIAAFAAPLLYRQVKMLTVYFIMAAHIIALAMAVLLLINVQQHGPVL